MGGGAREVNAIEISLVHVQQHLTWDCGVSAVMMVLSDKDRNFLKDNLSVVSKEEGFHESTWTIDLAYLLQKFGIQHLYSTITLGVNTGYTDEDFYQQVLKKDSQRIINRFQTAISNGVNIVQRSLNLPEIIAHLSSGNPAIVLVNANMLYCDICYSNKSIISKSNKYTEKKCDSTCKLNNCLVQFVNCCELSLSYQGHYIVLCGFDNTEKKVLYRNPTFLNRVCSMPYEAFDAARKSFGTDEDVLFVYINS